MWKRLLFLVFAAIVLHRIARFVWLLGFHRHIYNHLPGPCRRLGGIEYGAEDMQLLPGGKVLIPSGPQYLQEGNPNYPPDYTGKIFMYDVNQPDQNAQLVRIAGNIDTSKFHPVGITSWVTKATGQITVFIGNHKAPQSTVEKFHYDMETNILNHVETIGIGDDTFRILNNMIAINENQFYFTNYLHQGPSEIYLQLYWGTVVFYDGQKGHVAAAGFLQTNGINISPDGKYIYVSNVFEQEIVIYNRKNDNSLDLKERYPLHTIADNIVVEEETGHLLVGGVPALWEVFQYMDNPKAHRPPSQVLRLKVKDGTIYDVTEVLADNGTLLPTSTVAVQYKDKLLVGSINSHAIVCDIKYW